MPVRWRPAARIAVATPVIGLGLAALAPTGWYPTVLAQHWAPQLVVLCLPCWCWLGRRPLVGGGLLALTLAALWPSLLAAWSPRAAAPQAQAARVTSANLYFHRGGHEAAISRIDGDLVALIETRPEDRQLLRDDPRWPHQRWLQARGYGGSALLSRWPMRTSELDMEAAPGIDARVETPWGVVRVIALHTWSPTTPRYAERNRRQLAELAGIAATEPGPLLIMGDLNATPGDAGMRGLAATGLHRPHGGAPRTWPSWLGPAGISIDHILVRGLHLGAAEAIWLPGSDHRGITGRMSLPLAGGWKLEAGG